MQWPAFSQVANFRRWTAAKSKAIPHMFFGDDSSFWIVLPPA
jgi:hypothetical protein